MPTKILIADDDRSIRYSLRRTFEERGFTVYEAKTAKEAIELVQKEKFNLVMMDVRMAGMSGLDALEEIKKINPKQLVIIMTAFGTTETVITAMKLGAFDYIAKPFDISSLSSLVQKALEINRFMEEEVIFESDKCVLEKGECIVGNSLSMQEVCKLIGKVAGQDVTILIRGESGTGKELAARAIYRHSNRVDLPFLAVNCAALPETLLESELFGHEKGAFTDAYTRRIGKFEQCNKGTLFLDEIGDMSLTTQVKILRVIQEKEITPLGGNQSMKVDVRVLTATNQNLEKLIKDGKFREDLYYRLNVVSINLPPLRERKDDIPPLVEYFLRKDNKELGKEISGLNTSAMEKLMSYHWPGNVRELENLLKRACVLSRGRYILPADLPFVEGGVREKDKSKQACGCDEEDIELIFNKLYDILCRGDKSKEAFSVIEKAFIVRALEHSGGRQQQTAKMLGMNRNTLRNKIEKYGITVRKKVEGRLDI